MAHKKTDAMAFVKGTRFIGPDVALFLCMLSCSLARLFSVGKAASAHWFRVSPLKPCLPSAEQG
jgi:hypothetical protein